MSPSPADQGLKTVDKTSPGDAGASSIRHSPGTFPDGKNKGWDEEFQVGGGKEGREGEARRGGGELGRRRAGQGW